MCCSSEGMTETSLVRAPFEYMARFLAETSLSGR